MGGWRVAVYASLESTMDACRDLILRGDGDHRAVLAGTQSAGRGRRGRRWECPPGLGLLVSAALPLPALSPPLGLLAGAAGVACAEAVRAASGIEAALKWPNDLLAGGLKLGGVLLEVTADGHGAPWAVAGLGINLNQTRDDLPPEARDTATSLRLLTGQEWRADRLLPGVLERLDHEVALWARAPIETLRRWSELETTQGRPVWVHTPGGQRAATALRLTEEGALRVRWEDGSLGDLQAAEVSLRVR